MALERIGLYVGTSSIGAVSVQGRKLVSSVKFDLSSLEEETKVETLSEEIKWEALINKTMRDIGSDSKNIVVSLADRACLTVDVKLEIIEQLKTFWWLCVVASGVLRPSDIIVRFLCYQKSVFT